MKSLDHACRFLLDLERTDLVTLLRGASYQVIVGEDELWGFPRKSIEILSSPPCAEALGKISNADKKRILEAIADGDDSLQGLWSDENFLTSKAVPSLTSEPKTELLANIISQRGLMIDVATGGSRINDVNDYYRARRKRIIRALEAFQLEDPNPHEDLWDWYRKWRDEFPTYSERRVYAYRLYGSLIDKLSDQPPEPSPQREPTGWERVDRALAKARNSMDQAYNEEDFQTVGLVCREVLISLGQAVYSSKEHRSPDGVEPSKTDAKRMLEAYITAMLTGRTNETVRRHAKAALSLALDLQHRRTATYRMAALCLEATASTVNVIAILAGRRDRD